MQTDKQLIEDGYKIITLKVVGGELPGTTLAQKVGPLGIPAKVVGEDIKKATGEFKGLKMHVRLLVKDRKATIELTPSTATLILKALKEPVRDRKKVKNVLHNGSISLAEVVDIARAKRIKSDAADLAGTVREVLGTCVSIGCNIDGKSPKEVIGEIKQGVIKIPIQ